MIRVLGLIVALELMLGCDDPVVRAAVDAALDHGAVAARIECDVTTAGGPVGGAARFVYSAHKLVDGSAFVNVSAPDAGFWESAFLSRDQPDTATCTLTHRFDSRTLRFSAENGNLTIHCPECAGPSDTPDVFDIETECTGFNLEAFD